LIQYYKRRIAFRLLARIWVQQVQLRVFGRKRKTYLPRFRPLGRASQ
jgi:hypothetical protein